MTSIIDIIKNKDPKDVTLGELREFQLHIEEAEKHLSQMQKLYRSLTASGNHARLL